MKKRLFYGFTLFVVLFTVIAWRFAAAELAELQDDTPVIVDKEHVR